MVASRTPLLAAPLLVDCSSPRYPTCSSIQRFSAFSMGCTTSRLRTALDPRTSAQSNFKVTSMQSQTEKQTVAQAPQPSGHVPPQQRPRRGWLVGIAALLLFAGLFASGVVHRIHTNA